MDFVYWCAFAMFQTTFALFVSRRFGFGVARTGYFFAAFGVLGAIIQGGMIRPVVRRLGDVQTFRLGLAFGAVGLFAAAMTGSVAMFTVTLVPLAFGIGFGHPTMASLVSLVAKGDEQGRVQGAASAVESLGRTVGPVWGNASLQQFGESTPYLSAAALLLVVLAMTAGFELASADAAPVSRAG
jgi:DHA1 family tetracycline resistance protein-like MFS transporter